MRHTLQREIRKSYWAYIEDIIDYTADINNDRQTKQNQFWSYIKHLRKYSNGVSPLRRRGETFSDAPRKAKILNDEFSSVFTKETPGPFLTKGPVLSPLCQNITIATSGIQKLLANLKPHKATGPYLIPPTVLKELSHEISPILEIIFNISLQTGQVPNDWKEANIAPIFKKGDKHSPSNYRPVSLTCIIAKCMEHILVSNMMKQFELNNILHPLQHGFRKNYSCETRLLSLFQDIASNPSQVDLIIIKLSMNNTDLEPITDFNFLGIIINKHVKWNNHINKIANNIARANGLLNRLKHFLAPGILVNIYNCLILPHLYYGVLVWGYERTRIFKVQKKSLRAISSARCDAHTEPLFRNCNLLKIEDIHTVQQFKFFYKLTHKELPEYFNAISLIQVGDIHDHITRNRNTFYTKRIYHKFAEKVLDTVFFTQ